MKTRSVPVHVLSFFALLLLMPGQSMAAAGKQFVWLSDIHFDPLADPALTDKLAAAEISQWEAVLATSSVHTLSHFGEDTNWPLFSSAMQEIKKTIPDAEFTIVTGDLLVHHFRERFDKNAAVHDDGAFRNFARKTIEFVGLQLKQIAPAKPVFVSLGNNDADCGDYLLQPDGPFLHSMQPLMTDLLKEPNSPALDEWSKLGVYSTPHPTLRHYRIVAVNTVLLSARYRNTCGDGSADPGQALLTWLDGELAKAKQNHEKVWMIYHIPPGIDGFATFRHNDTVTPFWKPAYAEGFDRLLSRYHETIAASFAGHTHTDDFRFTGTSGGPRGLVLMMPGLTPLVNQNPAFRVVQFRTNGALTDQATYYLSSLDAPSWKLEYRFGETWGMRQLTYKNFDKLYRLLDASPEARQRWSRLYSVSHPEGGSITRESYRMLHCASGHTTVSDYQTCLTSTPGLP